MIAFLTRAGLLVSTSIAAATVAVAARSDGIKLSVGGQFPAAYMVVFDDDGEGEQGNEHNTDGLFQDAEIRFAGSTVLDNGLELGARVELKGESDDDQIGDVWMYFSGSFGEVRLGGFDEALEELCIVPPGGTENFSAFSPNQWGANTLTSNSVCEGVDDEGEAQKVFYVSPVFGGFQLGLSYTPSGDHVHEVSSHVGMPVNNDDVSRHNISLYATYGYEAEDWNIQIGAGGSWEGNVEKADGGPNRAEFEYYQGGILVGFGAVSVGAAFEYYNDDDLVLASLTNGDVVADRWVAGVGGAYELEEWTFGVGYSILDADIDIEGADDESLTQQRVALTALYNFGPGIELDGEIAYTWSKADLESEPDFDSAHYDAIEFGTGILIEF